MIAGLLTLAEVATGFDVSTRTVRRWIAKGLPSKRVGRMIVIDEKDLVRFFRQHEEIRGEVGDRPAPQTQVSQQLARRHGI